MVGGSQLHQSAAPQVRGLLAPSALISPGGRGLSAPPALVSTEVRGSLLHHSAVPQARLVGGSELHHIQSAVPQVGGSRLHMHSSVQMVGGSRLHQSTTLRPGAVCSTILRSLRLGWSGALNSTMLRLRLSAPPICSPSGSVDRGL